MKNKRFTEVGQEIYNNIPPAINEANQKIKVSGFSGAFGIVCDMVRTKYNDIDASDLTYIIEEVERLVCDHHKTPIVMEINPFGALVLFTDKYAWEETEFIDISSN